MAVSVDEAQARIREALAPLPSEEIAVEDAAGRVLAEPAVARLTQPPFTASAMDGYAVRFVDAREEGARLRLVGVSSAGAGFRSPLPVGAAVRIFTGAPVPEGADHVLIQEEARVDGETVLVAKAQRQPGNVRAAGLDFRKGDVLIEAGERLGAAAVALAAAGNVSRVKVRRKPRVALIANGDELVLPGERPGPDQIVCSIDVGLAAMIREWGGDATFLGVARDDKASIRALADQAFDADLIVPIGGASVGDKDYMRTVFAELGFRPVFDKVSVKPGKPTWFSVSGSWAVLGVPGNPASALVTAALFLQAALTRFLGARDEVGYATARTTVALPPAGARETFLRARFSDTGDGVRYVTPFDDQDSSLLSVMARANALIRRPAGAGPAAVGDTVLCLPLLRGSRVA